jgi:signal transduction histidine kinase
VEQHGGHLSIEVSNDEPLPGNTREVAPSDGARHGLIGMRERVLLYGGTLHADPQPCGGFTVRAVLPIVAAHSLDPVS